MHRFHSLFLSIILLLLATTPISAMDFHVSDFDPAPDNEAEAMEAANYSVEAIRELLDELMYKHTDSTGLEILSITPFPMELVGLMTQANIFDSRARTDEEIAPHLDVANFNKPGPNFFHFVIDCDAALANRNVSMWYVPDVGGTEGVMIPIYPLGETSISPSGTAIREFIVVADTMEEIQAFLFAASVKLIIEDGDQSIEPLIFDVGYWRSFGLFDLRTEQSENVELESEGEEVTEEN